MRLITIEELKQTALKLSKSGFKVMKSSCPPDDSGKSLVSVSVYYERTVPFAKIKSKLHLIDEFCAFRYDQTGTLTNPDAGE